MSVYSRAFRQLSATQSTAVTGVSQQVTINNLNGTRQLRVVNEGTQTVFIVFGEGANVTALTDGTQMALLANTVEIFTINPNVDRYAVIAGAVGSTIRTTVGEGL